MLQHSKSCARVPSGAVQCANELSEPAAAAAAALAGCGSRSDHRGPAACSCRLAAIAQGAAHTEHRGQHIRSTGGSTYGAQGSTPAETSKLLTSRIMSTGVSAVATTGPAGEAWHCCLSCVRELPRLQTNA